MTKKTFKSSIDKEEIFYYSWKIKNPKAVFQIVHGSIEYAMRYDEMAKHLNKAGYSVYMMDVRGHGETGRKNTFGHFADVDGSINVLQDVNDINEIIRKENKGKEIVLFGHSMGSFIVRAYATKYDDISMLIPCGTNHPPKPTIKLLASVSKKKSKKHGSEAGVFLSNLSYKAFDKKFKGQGELAWLSKSEQNRKNYQASDLTKFQMSNKAFNDMATWMKAFTNKKTVSNLDKNVPILLLNGKEDPVGNMGKDVRKATKFYSKLGYKVKHIEYDGMRHEITNEDDRKKVFNDIVDFVKENQGGKNV